MDAKLSEKLIVNSKLNDTLLLDMFSPQPEADPGSDLPPVLSMAGIQRLFNKSRRAVEMMVITDKIGSYKDGHITLCYVLDAVKLWGDPRKDGE